MTRPLRPRVRDDLSVVELDGEAVVFDEESGSLHHLNRTATLVFALCDGTASAAEMADELAGAFRTPRQEVEPQVRLLLRRMRRAGLLQERRDG